MVITREADYAVRLMVGIATRKAGSPVSARVLAEECSVPYELARTILGNLAEAGLLESRRGRSGGFMLAKPAETIGLSDVLAVAGESLQLNICIADPQNCVRVGECPMHPVWSAASEVLHEFLGRQTLASLVGSQA